MARTQRENKGQCDTDQKERLSKSAEMKNDQSFKRKHSKEKHTVFVNGQGRQSNHDDHTPRERGKVVSNKRGVTQREDEEVSAIIDRLRKFSPLKVQNDLTQTYQANKANLEQTITSLERKRDIQTQSEEQ